MSSIPLRRRLWFFNQLERMSVDQDFLTTDPRSIVVLGEAGMGKSTLLAQLKERGGYSVCTARKLINCHDPEPLLGAATTLVVDALDEVSARGEGEAVDLVLGKLSALNCPRFILSCRIADWRSATSRQGISDFYDDRFVELHLEPIQRDDALDFLTASLGVDVAKQTIEHLEKLGLNGLWSNPHTLELIEEVAKVGMLPQSKGELFQEATKLLRAEHREEKADSQLATLPETDVLDAAGAGFSSLILTGKEAISRQAQVDAGDAKLAEVAALPNADNLPAILASRLFEARAPERFTYSHRAIGEFLGARWLARTANTPRKRRRLIALFNSHAVVPASIRGIHAWLVWHSPELAGQVIAADPMGVIEYGDADDLSPTLGRALFSALNVLSRENPRFRDWVEYRASGLIQPTLFPEIRVVLTNPDYEFGLRLLFLQVLEGSEHISEFIGDLRSLMLDEVETYAIRYEAAQRLLEVDLGTDWTVLLKSLLDRRTEDGARLAIELMRKIGFERFSDRLVLEVIAGQLQRFEHTVGVFYGLVRHFPTDRIEALLDGIAEMAPSEHEEHSVRNALPDLAIELVSRLLATGFLPNPDRLWSWLRPFGDHVSSDRDSRNAVAKSLEANDELRRSVQRLVLLDDNSDKNIWYRAWRLADRSVGLGLTEMDVCALLDTLEVGDTRWREIVTLARHSTESGRQARAAAVRFALTDEDRTWLAGLENPPVPEWQVEQEKRNKKRATKRAASWTLHRAEFKSHIEALRSGVYGSVIGPAKAYLKLFQDMGDSASDGPARIEEWLGAEIKEAALLGFEAFLNKQPPQPNATDIAKSHAESRHWEAGYIIVVALAERLRTQRGFDDLPDERLMAGIFQLRHTMIDDHAGLTGLEPVLADALSKRGKWEAAQRLFLEPQLEAGLQNVDGLYHFLHSADHAELASALSDEWLKRFPGMSAQAEASLIDQLLSSAKGHAKLLELLPARASTALSSERRLNWDAVALIVNFQESSLLRDAATPIEPELLWQLRERLGGRRSFSTKLQLGVAQLAWAIRSFRTLFVFTPRPNGSTSGDRNHWDASDFIVGLINLLGDIADKEATDALATLRDAPRDGYTGVLRVAAAEQRRKRVEAEWSAPDLKTVAAAVADDQPTTSEQLQVVLLQELAEVQKKIRGSNLDWYKDFFREMDPRPEEDCRDTILKMLGDLPFGIQAAPEGHLADDKRCDIICTLGNLMVPIEVKGQWHKDLWTAADEQLDRLYTTDWRAECGIYLVLWFGLSSSKQLRRPPNGLERPSTADALLEALLNRSATARGGRTAIVVLDITRST